MKQCIIYTDGCHIYKYFVRFWGIDLPYISIMDYWWCFQILESKRTNSFLNPLLVYDKHFMPGSIQWFQMTRVSNIVENTISSVDK